MSAAEQITRHFGGDWQGNQGAFPTPGHSKSDRGTTVKDADGGDVIFYCHNDRGFDWRPLKDECRRLGLLGERPRSTANDTGPASWRETGRYEYATADGSIAYRTVRKERRGEPKRFVAQRPDGKGGWINGLGDVERVLYRLPEILAADPAEVVYLTEGERKADKLASWEMLATAVAFGARGWRDDYATALAGRTVAILPDNDDEGRGFAERAAKSIAEAGGRPVLVTLPGLPPKGDVINWSANGGSAFELRALTGAVLNPPVELFEIADLKQWARTPPTPKAFVMAPYIPREDVVIVTGDGGTNKSTLALQISACAAAGKPMLGMAVEPGPALYLTAEDDQRENHWRLAKIATAIGTTLDQLDGRLHVVSLRGRLANELATFDNEGKLRTAPAYKILRDTIRHTGAKLVTLDNVAHLFGGNENDRGNVTAFINLLYQLCGDFGVTVLLIAHRNKNGDTYSGSTAWLNAVRSQVLLERSDEHDADVRRMSLGKANYARIGEQVDFRWHDFALVRDEDLPDTRRREINETAAANAGNAAFLACLAERNAQRRQVSEKPTAANYAPRQFVGMPQAKGLTKERLERAMDRLFRIGAIDRGFLYRDTAEGKDIHGLREVGKPVPESPPEVPETSPETSRKQLPETSGDPHETTGNTLSYINIPGAATQAAAPVSENTWADTSPNDPDDVEWGA